VPAGTYSLTVERAGWLTATTGFTAYASMGGYSLAVAGASTATTTTTAPTTTTTVAPISTTTTTVAPRPPTTSGTMTTTLAPPPPVNTTRTTTTTTVPTTTAPPTVPPTVTPSSDPPALVGSSLVAVAPVRLLDTRSGVGGLRRLPAGGKAVVQVTGRNGVSSTATSAVLTLTAVAPGGAGYLSIFPCATGPTGTSAVNYGAGQVIANTTLATLDASGRTCVMSLADADVLIDMTGWLAEGTGSRLRPVGPIRVADTRSGVGGSPRIPAGGSMTLDLTRWAGADASAVALNVTVVDPDSAGYLTAYPCGGALPSTSTVNHRAREARPNSTIVGLGGGKVCVFSLAEADVLVDLVGVFGATGLTYVPTEPGRLLDTRDFGEPLPAGTEVEYLVDGPVGATAAAASVNVTAVGHTSDGFTSTYACESLPDTSTLNQFVGQIAANGAIIPLTPLATSCAWTLGGGHLLVDLNGWWI
jgi:hypothetical protein